jgi:hypothetical protein
MTGPSVAQYRKAKAQGNRIYLLVLLSLAFGLAGVAVLVRLNYIATHGM